MTRAEALSALFERESTQATQAAVDLVRGYLDLTEDDYEQLSDTVIHRMRAFACETELFLDSIEDLPQRSLLEQLIVPNSTEHSVPFPEMAKNLQELIKSKDWISARTAIERSLIDRDLETFNAWLRRMVNYQKGYAGENRRPFGEYMLQCIKALQRGDDPASTEYRWQFVTGSYTDGELLPP